MANLTYLCRVGFAVLAAGVLAGCATGGSAQSSQKEGRFMVGVKKSPFYKYGPAQTFGPDFALPEGYRVTLVSRSFGFSRVMTDDGVSGYMPTEDLVLAPAEPAPPPPSVRTVSRRAKIEGGSTHTGAVRKSVPPEKLEGSTPLFDVFDIPLPSDPEKAKPEADSGKPAEKPKFRARLR